jgi:hypothetical protein
MTNITPLLAVAINKFALAKADRNAVEPGDYSIDALVRVKGGVRVGEDKLGKITPQKARPWALLAVALSKLNGVTMESIVREAESIDDADVKQQASDAIAALKLTTETDTKGQVTSRGLTFEAVESDGIGTRMALEDTVVEA